MGKVTGAELIARSLVANDVTHFFNVAGLGIFPLVEAVHGHRDKIRYISGVNETAVSLAAEGYARATRRPGFLNVYHASGTALAMMALTVAWADQTPLILTTTSTARPLNLKDQYAAVAGPITETTRQYTKWCCEVLTVESIPDVIARAVAIACTPPMGPVHLAFPMDVYYETTDEDAVDSRAGLLQMYERSSADESGLARAAEMLAAAKMPLFAVGGEIGQYHAVDELVGVAEFLGAPVVTEGGRSTYLPFPTTHPLSVGRLSENAGLLEAADVVFLAGGFAFTQSKVGRLPLQNADKQIISMSVDPLQVNKQVNPDVGLVGHPQPSLARLLALLRERGVEQSAVRQRGDTVGQAREVVERRRSQRRDALLPSLAADLIGRLHGAIGADLVIVDHSNSGSPFVDAIPKTDPDRYYGLSQSGSAQGWGMPAAIGVQLANPGKRVVAIVGDGGFMFTSTALYTAARERVPLIVIVQNNGGWGAVGYNDRIKDGAEGNIFLGAFRDPSISIVGLASALGVQALKVSAPEDVDGALEKALALTNAPTVIEVVVDPESRRAYDALREQGSISL
jgi:thiamine pyrophosphate-dependent acetolactate synthase large subunit-like protein